MNVVIITGASSGIGQEFALQIDQCMKGKIDEIWLIARRQDRLQEIAKLMKHTTRCLKMDVSKSEDVEKYELLLKENKPNICMFVQSAGFGYQGTFSKIDLKDNTDMLDVNCKALTQLAYITIPYMHRGARMIVMASSAAFMPQAHFAVYAAAKAYVLSFARGLNKELEGKQVTVTAVCPGPVDTPFFDVAEKYERGLPLKKLTMITSDKVVRQALIDAKRKKDISIPGIWMRLFYILTKLVPHKWIMAFVQCGKGNEI